MQKDIRFLLEEFLNMIETRCEGQCQRWYCVLGPHIRFWSNIEWVGLMSVSFTYQCWLFLCFSYFYSVVFSSLKWSVSKKCWFEGRLTRRLARKQLLVLDLISVAETREARVWSCFCVSFDYLFKLIIVFRMHSFYHAKLEFLQFNSQWKPNIRTKINKFL